MRLKIHYRAGFRYEKAVSFSPHTVRLFPRQDLGLRIGEWKFVTDASADIQYRRDRYENIVASIFYPSPMEYLHFDLELQVNSEERNPFHFLLESRALQIPVQYDETERELLQAYLRQQEFVELPSTLDGDLPRSTVELLRGVVAWIHHNLEYERRESGAPRSPAETLRLGRGACRDFAVFLLVVLRTHGIACRLVSGYVWEGEVPTAERKAESALHAWVEVFVPGPGWIGLDPTNGVFCDHHFIPCASGLVPEDIAPVSGTYYSQESVGSRLMADLSIQRD